MRVVMMLRCLGMMRGGGETRHMAWMRELTAMGIDVEVITGGPLFGQMRFPVTDLACRDTTVIKSPYMRDLVYRTQGRRGLGRLGVVMLHTDEEWFCKLAWQHIASTAPRRRPDIVHAHALHQAARLRTIDVPVAINLPGEPNPRYHDDLRRADVLLSDGWGARKLPSILGRAVENITKGVDSMLFTPEGASVRNELGVGDAPVVLCVSRLVPIKNVALFVDAIAIVRHRRPDVRAVVVGDGPLESALMQRASALGVREAIRFAGYVDQQNLPRWYRGADVFGLSSDFDNSPNVLLEAMASGLPVVATQVGGNAELVREGETGVLVPPGDPAALAAALRRYLRDPDLRRAHARAARERAVASFSMEAMVRAYLGVYDHQLRRPALARAA